MQFKTDQSLMFSCFQQYVTFIFPEWNTLFGSWLEEHGTGLENFLHELAEAGNVGVLAPVMAQTPNENAQLGRKDKLGNTFLHIFAEKHNLKELFGEIRKIRTNPFPETDLPECFTIQNQNGYTFLAVAVNNVDNENSEKLNEKDVAEALKLMNDIYGKQLVSELCKQMDNGGNSLVHLAVRKSMTKLMDKIIPETDKAHEIENKDGHNPLHLAVLMNNITMVRCLLKQRNFDVNKCMENGETALHIAAQFGYTDILGELIKYGGNLSGTDKEDGHAPLHDCLQQVYFEGGTDDEEKCHKFIRVWNKVVEKSVTWWCLKQNTSEPANGSKEYLEIQRKAVYYLRSHIKNKNGLSVLQFAADRGLVLCVQMMLSTKDVFVKPNATQKGSFEIDITNLCPEYFVWKEVLFATNELKMLESKEERQAAEKNRQEHEEQKKYRDITSQNQEEDNSQDIISFLEALNQVKPPNKAGEILESIPMMTLTQAEWRISKRVHILWGILHFLLMLFSTIFTTHKNDSTLWSVGESLLGIMILIYATVVIASHSMVKIMRLLKMRQQKEVKFVQDSIKKYEKVQDDEGISAIPQKLLDETVWILELLFTILAWAEFAPKLLNLNMSDHLLIEEFFFLFGWLMLLIPLKSHNQIYKLISVLKYIMIYDILPWIIIYMIISIGFATAIKLQFQALPDSPPCVDYQPELKGFLQGTGGTLYELMVMTSGLDTDIKHVRSLGCIFKDSAKSVYTVLFLITMYAVISAVILLNMLIAIMSNTVTEAQQDKGWRQYQVSKVYGHL